MSPEKMIGLSFAAAAVKGYEVFDKLGTAAQNLRGRAFINLWTQEGYHAEFLHDAQLRRHAL